MKTGDPEVVDLTVKVTTPAALLMPDAAEIVSVAPRLEESVTVFPETGLPLESFSVTVIVDVVVPSAGTEGGAALTVELPALTSPAVKVTVAVPVIVTESVVSFAVKSAAPAVVDETANVTIPDASLEPDGAEMVSVAPRLEESVTVFPETGLSLESFNVTVIVDVVVPSAGTDRGAALTVDVPALTGPAVKVTVAVSVIVTESVVSFAVRSAAPAVVDETANVTIPDASLEPDGAEIVSVAPRLEESVTVLPDTGFPFLSVNVTVTIDVVAPSATTDGREALTVEAPESTAPAVNVTVAVWRIVTPAPVVSSAVKSAEPAVVEVTVNVTFPDESLGPEAAEIVSVAPRLEVKVTVSPATGVRAPSRRVTVTVDMSTPSAVTVPGAAETVELDGSAACPKVV